MGFSITGNLLTGTSLRPDFITFTRSQGDNVIADTLHCSKLNKLGYKTGIGFFSGTFRASLGLVHTIIHFAIAAFKGICGVVSGKQSLKDAAKHHFSESGLGLKNFGRGLIEMIPIFGGLILQVVDKKRVATFEDSARSIAKTNPIQQSEFVSMFYCGKQINTPRPVAVLAKMSNFNPVAVTMQTLEEYVLREDKTLPRHISDPLKCTQMFNVQFE